MIVRSRLVLPLLLLAAALAVFNWQYSTYAGVDVKYEANSGVGQSRKVLSKLKRDLVEAASGDDQNDNLPDDFEVPGWGKGVDREVATYVKRGVDTALLKPRLSIGACNNNKQNDA